MKTYVVVVGLVHTADHPRFSAKFGRFGYRAHRKAGPISHFVRAFRLDDGVVGVVLPLGNDIAQPLPCFPDSGNGLKP